MITNKIVKRDKTRVGQAYFKSLRGYQTREDILERLYNSIEKKLFTTKKTLKIIDLGCGPGIVGKYLFKKIKNKSKLHMSFLDINPSMLKVISKDKNFSIIQGDVTNLNLKYNNYDIATMKQVLDYLPRNLQIKTLKETYKILKNKGEFIFSALISQNSSHIELTNHLYTKREEILHPLAPIKKYIPSKQILKKWLKSTGFKKIKFRYEYDIPLSIKDFVISFGLNKKQEQKLKNLYEEIITKDVQKVFNGKKKLKDIELTEKGMIISCYK